MLPEIDSETYVFLHNKLAQKRFLKSGDGLAKGPLGTTWGSPWEPGPEIDDSVIDSGTYLNPIACLLKIDTQSVPEGHIQAILYSLTS